MARPSLFAPKLLAAILADVEAGATYESAAILNGLGESTLRLWTRQGRAGVAPFAEFVAALTCARARAQSNALRAIREAKTPSGAPDWRACAWLLERLYPEQFAPHATVNAKVSRELDAALDRLEAKLPAEVFEQVIAAMATDEAA